jgi:hypothetical protein
VKCWAGGITQVVEHLPNKPSKPSKHETLSSSPSTIKKKKRKKETEILITHSFKICDENAHES